MGHKAAETIHRVNNPFGLGTAMKESTGVVKKFWNGDKRLEAKRAQWLTIGTWQRPTESNDQSWSPYVYMGCCTELSMDHSKVIWNKFKRGKISVCVGGGSVSWPYQNFVLNCFVELLTFLMLYHKEANLCQNLTCYRKLIALNN